MNGASFTCLTVGFWLGKGAGPGTLLDRGCLLFGRASPVACRGIGLLWEMYCKAKQGKVNVGLLNKSPSL